MALELMYAKLVAELGRLEATDSEKNAWMEQWGVAVQSKSLPLPCPNCFVSNRFISRLKSLDTVDGQDGARCEDCSEEYWYPEDNK